MHPIRTSPTCVCPPRWDLSKLMKCQDEIFRGDDRNESVKVLHREHGRSMYSIVPVPGGGVVSSGQDRFIVSSQIDDSADSGVS